MLLAELSDLKMFVWGLYAKICLETLYILLLLDIFFMRGRFELINLENKRVLIPTNNDSLFLCTIIHLPVMPFVISFRYCHVNAIHMKTNKRF